MPPLPNGTIFFDDDKDDALEDDDDKRVTSSNGVLTLSPLEDKERLTKQERLAVECLKPRLQVNILINSVEVAYMDPCCYKPAFLKPNYSTTRNRKLSSFEGLSQSMLYPIFNKLYNGHFVEDPRPV